MPTGTPLELTKEFLEEEHIRQNKSYRAIARELGCDKKVVSLAMKKHGLTCQSKPGNKPTAWIGREFHSLKVVAFNHKDQRKRSHWLCECSCENKTRVVVLGASLASSHTKSCGCRKDVSADRSKYVGEISGSYWSKVVTSARKRGLSITITQQEIWELFLKQNRRCALTGLIITLPIREKDRKNSSYTASLDRKDSSLGYHIDNVQWVDKRVNILKFQFPEDEFIELCCLIAKHRGQKWMSLENESPLPTPPDTSVDGLGPTILNLLDGNWSRRFHEGSSSQNSTSLAVA